VQEIVRETRLPTDESKLYFGMDKDYSRETVRHSGEEYARDGV